jgi:hypothetical protein
MLSSPPLPVVRRGQFLKTRLQSCFISTTIHPRAGVAAPAGRVCRFISWRHCRAGSCVVRTLKGWAGVGGVGRAERDVGSGQVARVVVLVTLQTRGRAVDCVRTVLEPPSKVAGSNPASATFDVPVTLPHTSPRSDRRCTTVAGTARRCSRRQLARSCPRSSATPGARYTSYPIRD